MIDLDPFPLAGHPEPGKHPEGEIAFNDRVRAVVPSKDSSSLLAEPAPPAVRAAVNYLPLFLRPWLWWGGSRLGGAIATVPAGASWAFEQGSAPPIDVHHGDTVRIDPEPWSRFTLIGG